MQLQQSGVKKWYRKKKYNVPNEQKKSSLRFQGIQYIARTLSRSIVYTLVLILRSILSILPDLRLTFFTCSWAITTAALALVIFGCAVPAAGSLIDCKGEEVALEQLKQQQWFCCYFPVALLKREIEKVFTNCYYNYKCLKRYDLKSRYVLLCLVNNLICSFFKTGQLKVIESVS